MLRPLVLIALICAAIAAPVDRSPVRRRLERLSHEDAGVFVESEEEAFDGVHTFQRIKAYDDQAYAGLEWEDQAQIVRGCCKTGGVWDLASGDKIAVCYSPLVKGALKLDNGTVIAVDSTLPAGAEAHYLVVFKGKEPNDSKQPTDAYLINDGSTEGCKWNKAGKKFECTDDAKKKSDIAVPAGKVGEIDTAVGKKIANCAGISNAEEDTYGHVLYKSKKHGDVSGSDEKDLLYYMMVTLDGNSMKKKKEGKKPIVEMVTAPLKTDKEAASAVAMMEAWSTRKSAVEAVWGSVKKTCLEAKLTADECPSEEGDDYATHIGDDHGGTKTANDYLILHRKEKNAISRQVNYGATVESLMSKDFADLYVPKKTKLQVTDMKVLFPKCQAFAKAYAKQEKLTRCDSEGFLAIFCASCALKALADGSPRKGDFDQLFKVELFEYGGIDASEALINGMDEKDKIIAAIDENKLKTAFAKVDATNAAKMAEYAIKLKTGKTWSSPAGKCLPWTNYKGVEDKVAIVIESRSGGAPLNKMVNTKKADGILSKVKALTTKSCADGIKTKPKQKTWSPTCKFCCYKVKSKCNIRQRTQISPFSKYTKCWSFGCDSKCKVSKKGNCIKK